MIDITAVTDFILEHALKEDLSDRGDVTSLSLFDTTRTAVAQIRSKASGVLSGAWLLEPLCAKCSHDIRCTLLCSDGTSLEAGTVIARIQGPILAILAVERTALNFLQRLSGIATATSQLVEAIAHTNARLLDTRKTTPLLRVFEKKAVVHGGGCNHRFGLFDMVLLKDTHVKAAGGPGTAVRSARQSSFSRGLTIEVEVQSISEFHDAFAAKPDRIMLDNMNLEDMSRCVEHVRSTASKIELEASGNVTLESVKAIAETGVDFISCGAITHSAPSLDIHLLIE